MYIYNETINIEESVHDQWLIWMKQEYIPAMLATGKFLKALMTRVIVEQEVEGITYSVQYTTDSRETLQKYYRENSEKIRSQNNPFQGKFVAFRTELEVIGEAHNEHFEKS